MNGKQPEGEFLPFFKVYLPTCATRISIPITYVSYMEGKIPKRAFLRHGDRKVWPIGVEKFGNGWFFNHGWAKYVQDNSLEPGQFLIFQYDGHKHYDVKLIGKYGTEKNAVEVLEEEEEDLEAKCKEEEVENLEKVAFGKRTAVGDASSSQRNRKESKGEKPEAKADKGKHKRISLGPYGDNIFKSGLIHKPENPYFVTSIRGKRRNELYLPVDFVEDHSLSLLPEITLHDHKGRKWSSKLTPWKDGRLWYYGGWGRLCKVNMVAENDTCICELKRGADGVPFFQVHIVREDMLLKLGARNN